MTARRLYAIYKRLREHFGHRDWWPGESPLEVAVGAILTQNTAWKNVEKAIANLRAANALELTVLIETPVETLALWIRPSGYFNQKAKKLAKLARFIADELDGELPALAKFERDVAREKLLALWGVGPETADSILLYAANVPVFVIDAYTLRAGRRLGLFTAKTDYETARALFESRLPPDAALFNDFHAQWVALGHHYCRPRPLCAPCPLRRLCPVGRGLRRP